MLDHFAVVRLLKKSTDALGHHRTHVIDLQQLLCAGCHDAVQLAEMPGQRLGGGLTHMADTQTEQETRQSGLLGCFNRFEQVVG